MYYIYKKDDVCLELPEFTILKVQNPNKMYFTSSFTMLNHPPLPRYLLPPKYVPKRLNLCTISHCN